MYLSINKKQLKELDEAFYKKAMANIKLKNMTWEDMNILLNVELKDEETPSKTYMEYKRYVDGKKEDVCGKARDNIDLFLGHRLEKNDCNCDNASYTQQKTHDRPAEDVDTLFQADGNHTDQRSGESGDHDRDKDVCGVGSAHLCAVYHHGNRDQRQSRCIQDQEHDHGIGSLPFLRVDLL